MNPRVASKIGIPRPGADVRRLIALGDVRVQFEAAKIGGKNKGPTLREQVHGQLDQLRMIALDVENRRHFF